MFVLFIKFLEEVWFTKTAWLTLILFIGHDGSDQSDIYVLSDNPNAAHRLPAVIHRSLVQLLGGNKVN